MSKEWNKLSNRQKMGKKERFDFIMSKINNVANGVDSDVDFESRVNALEERIAVLEEALDEEDEADRKGNVSVSVKGGDDKGIGNVTVVLSKASIEYSGVTGSAGGCNINDVFVGEYDVNVLLGEGNIFEYGKFTVAEGDNELNIRIENTMSFNVETPTLEEEEGEF